METIERNHENIKNIYYELKNLSNSTFAWFIVSELHNLLDMRPNMSVYLRWEQKNNKLRIKWCEPWSIIDMTIGGTVPSSLVFEYNQGLPKAITVFYSFDNGSDPFDCKEMLVSSPVKEITIKKMIDIYNS